MSNADHARDLVEITLEEMKRALELAASVSEVAQAVLPKALVTQLSEERAASAVYFALWSDVLRAVILAVVADGQVTEAERAFVYPLLSQAARIFGAEGGPEYRPFEQLAPKDVWAFLTAFQKSKSPFGGAHPESKWVGLEACRGLSLQVASAEPLAIYERMILRVVDNIIALDGMTNEEAIRRRRLKDVIMRRREMTEAAMSQPPAVDHRGEAFLSAAGGVVFHAIAHAKDVFSPDPFDVDTIHGTARDAFEQAVRLAREPARTAGISLLVHGRAGSGKTHLMRAFRRMLHEERWGYAAYLQMSSRSDSYARYVLCNVVDSLERPYFPPELEDSGLLSLSNALVERPEVLALRLSLQDEELEADEVGFHVGRITDALLSAPELRGVDPHVLSALVILQRREPAVRSRVVKYLRCEPLTAYERQILGDLPPRLGEEMPLRTLAELGRLIGATGGGALVLLVDQMEDAYNLEQSKENFRRSQDALRALQEEVPNSVVVQACLEDYYFQLRGFLSQAVLDRLERDPEPVRLAELRSRGEIEAMISARLQHLFEGSGANFREDEPLFPFQPKDLEALVNLRTRDVLDACRRHQETCRAAGSLTVPFAALPSPKSEAEPAAEPQLDLEQRWNDLRSTGELEVPSSEEEQAILLHWALQTIGVDATCTGPRVELKRHGTLVEVVNGGAQGGHFGRRVEALSREAGARRAVLARASEFPGKIGSKAYELLGTFVGAGGQKVVMDGADLRAIVAFQRFQGEHGADPRFAAWTAEHAPLAGLAVLRELMAGATPEPAAAAAPVQSEADPGSTVAPPEPPPEPPTIPAAPAVEVPSSPPGAPLTLGVTRTLLAEPVTLTTKELKTHAAFLGASGSGKTTLALNLIEQLVLQGIPALVVDRKGDLTTYGLPDAWAQPLDDPSLADRRARLEACLDVKVYTPGEARGRPLAIPVVPRGLSELGTSDRAMVARHAAWSLAGMMGYRSTQQDKARVSILAKAVEVLGTAVRDRIPTVNELVDLLHHQDPSLLNAIGRLDTRHFGKIVEGLETLRLQSGHLLDPEAEQLDPAALLGLGEHRVANKTRLTVLSTKFLNDTATVQFWVARLLVELSRWASRNPSDKLQAVLLLDEADIYLPAMEKPATKEPLLDLLRRARSAGLGVLLATQSPGDLDYKARDNIGTWFVGKVAEKTAINKMKPLFSEYRGQVAERLALCQTGDFFRLRGGAAVELKASRCVMETQQLPEDTIIAIARNTSGR